jgi:hypothetical protein
VWAGLAPKEVDDAVLITNALVSNAIDHTRTQCCVTLRLTEALPAAGRVLDR